MAIELEKNTISINQIIANKIENTVIEGDCIVPDVKPDIMEIIGASGIVNIYKKEVSEGKVRIDGCINVYIMYIGDSGNGKSVRSINHTLDFSQIISVENATSDMNENGKVILQNIECKVINERKINLKANVNFEVKIFTNSNVEFVNNANLNDIQKLENKITINSVMGIGGTKTSTKETINIDNTDNLAEILKVNAQISNEDVKISYNKILTKADIKLKILYSTDDGRINTAKATFPIMGFIDMQNVSENNICEPEFEIKNMIIKPNGSMEHSIYIEIETGINVTVYENKEINVIQDLYSPSTNLKFVQKDIKTMQSKNIVASTLSFNQKTLIDIGDAKVYDADVQVRIENVKPQNDAILIGGNMQFVFTYGGNEPSEILTKSVSIPFEHKMECKGINPNSNIQMNYDIISEDYNIMPGGEIAIKLDVNFIANTANLIDINLIDNIEEDENGSKNNYNMVIYFTRASDNLWKIAKEFGSTKNNIIQANELKNENLIPGMQLFIPKYMG